MSWSTPAQELIDRLPADWEGLWSLVHALALASLNLATTVPLAAGVQLSYAAMDFRDAQDEVEWARPNIRCSSQIVRLGHVNVDELEEARELLGRLAAVALDRAVTLTTVEPMLADQAALARAMARLVTGRAKVLGSVR